MKSRKNDDDEKPKLNFEVGWRGFKTSGSGSMGVIAAALLALVAIMLLHLPFIR